MRTTGSPCAFVFLVGLCCSHCSLQAQQSVSVPATPEQKAQASELNRDAAQAITAGDFARAIDRLERALKLLPGDPGLSLNLGMAYLNSGRLDDAAPPLRQAATDTRYAGKARFLLGAAYYGSNKFDLAIEELRDIRHDPAYAEKALYFLEESYRRTGKLAAAEEAFVDLANKFPASALVHKLLGTALDAQGHYAEARREFELASRADPTPRSNGGSR